MAIKTWTGAVDEYWDNAANWSGGKPGSNDTAVLTGSGLIAIDGGGQCQILDTSGFTGTFACPGELTLSTSANNTTLDLHAGMSVDPGSNFNFYGGINITINAPGKTFNFINANAFGGANITLASNLTIRSPDIGPSVHLGSNVLTIAPFYPGQGLVVGGASTWTWSSGGKIVFAPTMVGAQIWLGGAASPSLPPAEHNGTNGSMKLNTNATFHSFTQLSGASIDLNGFTLTALNVVTPPSAPVAVVRSRARGSVDGKLRSAVLDFKKAQSGLWRKKAVE